LRPLIPHRDAVFVEILDVGVAAQKPEQFINDRFDVQLFRCQQREPRTTWPQIEARLRTKDRQRAGAGAISARLTFFQNKPEKIVILPHAKSYRACKFRKAILLLDCGGRRLACIRETKEQPGTAATTEE